MPLVRLRRQPSDPRLELREVVQQVIRDAANCLVRGVGTRRFALAFAGLYERWREPTGQLRWTATIITTAASGPLTALHDRMPMVVAEPNWEAWLDPDLTNAHEALSLPMSPGELLTAYPVHPRVGSVRESGSGLIAPVETASEVLDFR